MTDNAAENGEKVPVIAEALFAARYGSDRAWEQAPKAVREALTFDAKCVVEALGPDDLDALVGSEAKDAESVYWFAKAAVRADRARLPRHRDIVWNIWGDNVQRRVGWLSEGLPYAEPVFSSIEVVTDFHDGEDCPFIDGDDVPMVDGGTLEDFVLGAES